MVKVILWGHFWICTPDSEPRSILAFGSSRLNLQRCYSEQAVNFPHFIFPIRWAGNGNDCPCLDPLPSDLRIREEMTERGHARSHSARKWQSERQLEWLGDKSRTRVQAQWQMQTSKITSRWTNPSVFPCLFFPFKVKVPQLQIGTWELGVLTSTSPLLLSSESILCVL